MDVSQQRDLISKAAATDSRMILGGEAEAQKEEEKKKHKQLDLKHKCISLHVNTIKGREVGYMPGGLDAQLMLTYGLVFLSCSILQHIPRCLLLRCLHSCHLFLIPNPASSCVLQFL